MIKREIRSELEKRLPQHVLDYLTEKFEEFEKAAEKVKKLEEALYKSQGQNIGFEPQYSQGRSYGPTSHWDYDLPYMARRGGYEGGYGAVAERGRDSRGRFMDIRGQQGGQGGGSQGGGGGSQGGGQGGGPSNYTGEQRGRVRAFPNRDEEQEYEF